jgi:hypothetical protein
MEHRCRSEASTGRVGGTTTTDAAAGKAAGPGGPLHVESELYPSPLGNTSWSPGWSAARYARISFDKAGDEHGVADQLAGQQRVAGVRGFVIVRTECDSDVSALNGTHRPGYEAVMAAAAREEIDVVLVLHHCGRTGEHS